MPSAFATGHRGEIRSQVCPARKEKPPACSLTYARRRRGSSRDSLSRPDTSLVARFWKSNSMTPLTFASCQNGRLSRSTLTPRRLSRGVKSIQLWRSLVAGVTVGSGELA